MRRSAAVIDGSADSDRLTESILRNELGPDKAKTQTKPNQQKLYSSSLVEVLGLRSISKLEDFSGKNVLVWPLVAFPLPHPTIAQSSTGHQSRRIVLDPTPLIIPFPAETRHHLEHLHKRILISQNSPQ